MNHIDDLSQSNCELRNAVCLLLLRIGSLEEALSHKPVALRSTASSILSDDEITMLNQLF
ncbi:hypothetical protein [Shewanella surugensis]|uniref:Uncharacterized protein n=1 Tax=Shewanella surugensis TaxID=212020 RepID=A0ABT0LH78_9GAMM|nr:hypothetical protein [Shewanella surugensis]MCL1127049.1 hypothetical protein [Shewanella surugensis]